MTDVAIKILKKNPKGFFLMVEAGQIDWAGHVNEAQNNMVSTLGLDDAVTVGLDFVNANSNALMIVTADHEIGGMSTS